MITEIKKFENMKNLREGQTVSLFGELYRFARYEIKEQGSEIYAFPVLIYMQDGKIKELTGGESLEEKLIWKEKIITQDNPFFKNYKTILGTEE